MVSAYVERMATPGEAYYPSINEAVRGQAMILDSSRYWEVYSAYSDRFGGRNVKVVWFEEYTNQLDEVFQDVCRFLEIDERIPPRLDLMQKNARASVIERISASKAHRREPNTRWTDEARQWVEDQIREETHRFLAHFGRRLDYWGLW